MLGNVPIFVEIGEDLEVLSLGLVTSNYSRRLKFERLVNRLLKLPADHQSDQPFKVKQPYFPSQNLTMTRGYVRLADRDW
jgi:hypothetical protein